MSHVLITGTPAAGKTTVAKALLDVLNKRPDAPHYEYLNVSEEVISKELYSSYDEEFKSYVPDDKKLRQYLKQRARNSHIVFDHHTPYILKGLGVGVCGVVRAPTEVIYDRMQARGYSEHKISENVEAEIMQVCLDEAVEVFGEEKVIQCTSTDSSSLDSAVQALCAEIAKMEREEHDGARAGQEPDAAESGSSTTPSASQSSDKNGDESNDPSFEPETTSGSDDSYVGELSDVKTESSSESSVGERRQKL